MFGAVGVGQGTEEAVGIHTLVPLIYDMTVQCHAVLNARHRAQLQAQSVVCQWNVDVRCPSAHRLQQAVRAFYLLAIGPPDGSNQQHMRVQFAWALRCFSHEHKPLAKPAPQLQDPIHGGAA